MLMSKIFLVLGSWILLLTSCLPNSGWQATEAIMINDISPIGITIIDDRIWLADGDHNRMVQINMAGKVISTIDSVERPMHLCTDGETILIPSYGSDAILMLSDNGIDTLDVSLDLDAPAAIATDGNMKVIADFYNHRLVVYDDDLWTTWGEKGEADGQFHYPTDVHIYNTKVYVADAYNNRGQVFDRTGNHLLSFGEEEDFNAATGIFVNEEHIYLTDFENDRLLVFDHQGEKLRSFDSGFDKPIDVIELGNELWVLNYKGQYISRFVK